MGDIPTQAAEKYAARSVLARGLISEDVAVELIKEIDEKISELEEFFNV